ncbi:Putative ubiquitin-conjugating enzyme [Heterostelium album PN500]|uniref:Ubiquitin-conjugating enzyme n=1 Tax=Heterostelium pallidum (strain ATCC 26659 / Pp 5 / PN500) TaxID=670386 RepID=D3B7G0_HETP5|nr:Putative ubiquitin-conjugating enzyme [Heterostelium album PN500]EFA82703.1 Putative ubiquitin-conjugating enzyme [Heterostelium album PN500]|eukprot:XP_020434820.1 Putative ubiquitin-conjugating enzyme [Heterostelium album PN500]
MSTNDDNSSTSKIIQPQQQQQQQAETTKVERNIFKEDIVTFINPTHQSQEFGVVAKLSWEDNDNLDDDDEEDDGKDDKDSEDEELDDEDDDDDEEDGDDCENEDSLNSEDSDSFVDMDETINTYKFKNQVSGVLIQKPDGSLLELDFSELTMVDRTLYIGDNVQRNQSDSAQLGKVLSMKKTYHVIPFEFLNTLIDTTRTFDETWFVTTDHVRPPTEYQYGVLVMDQESKVIGSITEDRVELKIKSLDDPNLVGNFLMSKMIKVEGLYDESVCKGKIVNSVRGKGLIMDVKSVNVDVNWYFYIDLDADEPNPKQKTQDVILIKDDYDYSIMGESVLYRDKEGVEQGGMVWYTETKYKILWQDGLVTLEASLDLTCVDNLSTDYFPGDVVEPAEKEKKTKWGVIKQYNPEKRTCSVYWKSKSDSELPVELEEDVSVYLIEYIEDDNIDESDFVLRKDSASINPLADVVGQVIGKSNETCQVVVRWNNGCEETLYPQDLAVVEQDDEEVDDDDDQDSDTMDAYDPADYEDDINDEANISKVARRMMDHEDELVKAHQTTGNSFLQNVLNYIKKYKDDIGRLAGLSINDNNNNNSNSIDNSNSNNSNNNNNVKVNDKEVLEESSKVEEEVEVDDNNEERGEFELLTSIDNHAFFNEKVSMTSKFLSAINKEIKLLQTSLPKGIYVKGYSERMNLLQALIVGPGDTVYENGVFIFDIYLPNQYPFVPPKVFYHSVTFKLHPNLYVNGNTPITTSSTDPVASNNTNNNENNNNNNSNHNILGITLPPSEGFSGDTFITLNNLPIRKLVHHLPLLKVVQNQYRYDSWPSDVLSFAVQERCSTETIKFLLDNRTDQDIIPSIFNAIKNTDIATIDLILKSVSSQFLNENQSKLTIKIIASNGDTEIVDYLQSKFKTIDWIGSIEYAACRKQFDIVRYLVGFIPDNTILSDNTVAAVAKYGDLETLEWLFTRNQSQTSCFKVIDLASKHNRLDNVKWLHENRTEGCSKAAMIYASTNGNIQLVKWLHENRTEGCDRSAMNNASANGHLETVEWLSRNRSEGCSGRALNQASLNGHLSVVQFLCANFIDSIKDQLQVALINAASFGHIDIVKYLFSHPLIVIDSAINKVFNYDYPEIIYYLFREMKVFYKIERPSQILDVIVLGRLHAFKTIHQLGLCDINSLHFNYAASYKQFEFIKYIHQHVSNKVTNYKSIIRNAFSNVHIDMIRYLIRICPNDLEEIMSLCLNVNRIELIGLYDVVEQLLIESKTTFRLDIRPVVRSGDIDMLKLLIKYQHKYQHADRMLGCRVRKFLPSTFHSDSIKNALDIGDIEMATYLYEELKLVHTGPIKHPFKCLESYHFIYDRFPNLLTKDIIFKVASGGQLDVLKFLLERIQLTVSQDIINRAFDFALQFGQFPMVKYLGSLQSEKICSSLSSSLANRKGYRTVYNYVKDNNYKIG